MPRRTTEQQILDLESKIQSIKARAERKKIRANPAVKFMKAGLKSIVNAMEATDDAVIKKSLEEARLTLSSNLSLLGVKGSRGVLNPRPRTKAARVASTDNGDVSQPDANDLLAYLKNNPGSSSETITKQFSTDAVTLRPVMKQLIDDGKVKTKGQRRGTRYFVGV